VHQRRIQVGTKERSERIRTYTVTHDVVTDHRLGRQVVGVARFLRGQEELDGVMAELQEMAPREALDDMLQQTGG